MKTKVIISTEPTTGRRQVYRPKMDLPGTVQVAVERGDTLYVVTISLSESGIPMTRTLEIKR